ncbi:(5-formylfuran-3-yl)methyl phosphate synthase [Paraburkholderia sp. LEh10]|uniref:(5-formylfuran-3-yl)methyl phosphate synthase n=1 Tax=Paraburkholderia sp. LEh10 TaxID=2821353 RepID=UPI001AE9E09E|nr:(5-formylfuran-3-yl)methyl phosphate synthase [Paraburkholderia sp. LEh10]MBP0588485.1 (5-formylfuran-3-yl)methyl phosphate synthase [Paraburkholderia sp. LEh10]
MIRMLASVRNLDEARDAASAGADLIDLKEPGAGALGAVSAPSIADIVQSLRAEHPRLPISAAIGDLRPGDHASLEYRASQAGRCGVDYVKAGVPADSASFDIACRTLSYMRGLHWNMVPVLLVDNGLDLRVVEHACELRFAGVMVDTASKKRGNLFQCVPLAALDSMVQIARVHDVMPGLAGALLSKHVPLIRALGPEIAGFRTALCDGSRTGRLNADRVRDLRAQLSGRAAIADPAAAPAANPAAAPAAHPAANDTGFEVSPQSAVA